MEHSLISDDIFFPVFRCDIDDCGHFPKIKQQHKIIYIGIPVAAFIWLAVYLSA